MPVAFVTTEHCRAAQIPTNSPHAPDVLEPFSLGFPLTRAGYGQETLERRSMDLQARFGRGFGRRNLFQMRAFYLAYPEILQTLSAQFGAAPDSEKVQTPSALFAQSANALGKLFPLPWSR
jgi:hypothetical protein